MEVLCSIGFLSNASLRLDFEAGHSDCAWYSGDSFSFHYKYNVFSLSQLK